MTTAAAARKKRKMTDSPALMQSALAKRLTQQVLVTGVTTAASVLVLQPDEFDSLNIDETYQRVMIGSEVNALITVLKSGGQIADPAHLAQRPDGSLWIVDGQQRFWAHRQARVPLKAIVHRVENHDAEVRLFIALNSRRRLSAKSIVRGWPGPFGDWLRTMNTSDKSPLKGMIDFGNNSKLPFEATTMMRALLALLTSMADRGGDTATNLLPRLDHAMKAPHARAWADALVQLIAAVFGPNSGKGGRRVRMLPVVALAKVAGRKFAEAGRPVFPTSTARLRAVNWDVQVPSHSRQYLPLLEQKIERLWK